MKPIPPAKDRSELQFKIVMALAEHIRCPAGQPSIVHDWPLGELMAIIESDRQQSLKAQNERLRRLGEKIKSEVIGNDSDLNERMAGPLFIKNRAKNLLRMQQRAKLEQVIKEEGGGE